MNKIKPIITPKTRKEQCKLLITSRFRNIISIGLLNILFFIPLIVVFIFKVNYTNVIISSFGNPNPPTEDSLNAVRLWHLIFDAIQIISIMIISIGISGSMKVIKTLCYGEPVIFWENFKQGVKENWKNYLLTSLFFSFTLLIVNFSRNSSGLMESKSISMLSWAILGIFIFVISPILVLGLAIDATYKNKLGSSFKSALVMLLRHYFGFIYMPAIMFVSYIAIFLMQLFSLNIYIIVAISLLMILYILPIFMFLGYEYSLYLFDKYINSNYMYKR